MPTAVTPRARSAPSKTSIDATFWIFARRPRDSRRARTIPAALAHPDVKLHLYGKLEPRVGRKMGHLTALNRDAEAAYRTVEQARKTLL